MALLAVDVASCKVSKSSGSLLGIAGSLVGTMSLGKVAISSGICVAALATDLCACIPWRAQLGSVIRVVSLVGSSLGLISMPKVLTSEISISGVVSVGSTLVTIKSV